MNALENFTITKQAFEEMLDDTLTDTQWANLVDEINGRVDNYLDELLGNLIVEVQEGEWD
jgi:hypothetical protein